MKIENFNDHEIVITVSRDQSEVIKIALRQFANTTLKGMPADPAKTPDEKAALKEDKKIATQIHDAITEFETTFIPELP